MPKPPAAAAGPRRAPRRGPAAARRRRVARFTRHRVYLLGLGALLVLLGVMASGPYADYTAAQERVDALEQQQAELDEAVMALESEADRLQDPAALEEQARSQLGLVRPGEVPYIVVNPPTTAPEPVNANPDLDPEAEAAGPTVVQRVTGWFSGLLD